MDNRNHTPRTDKDREAEVTRFRHKQIATHYSLSTRREARRRSAPGCVVLPFFVLVAIVTTISLGSIISMAEADSSRVVIGGDSHEDEQLIFTDRFSFFPEIELPDIPPTPEWEVTAKARGVGDYMVEAVQSASDSTGVAGTLLLAVVLKESGGEHYRADGRVKRGAAGEIGAMQVMPGWHSSIKRIYGLDLDLYDPADNMHAAAIILTRGGYDPLNPATIGPALAYYNTGQHLQSTRYSRAVQALLAEIEGSK